MYSSPYAASAGSIFLTCWPKFQFSITTSMSKFCNCPVIGRTNCSTNKSWRPSGCLIPKEIPPPSKTTPSIHNLGITLTDHLHQFQPQHLLITTISQIELCLNQEKTTMRILLTSIRAPQTRPPILSNHHLPPKMDLTWTQALKNPNQPQWRKPTYREARPQSRGWQATLHK